MTISTYQLFKNRYMIIYDRKNTRYKKFTEGASVIKIIAGAIQIYAKELKNSVIKLLGVL